MFNGIITHIGKVNNIFKKKNSNSIEIFSKLKFKKKDIGASVSCSGACLTITKLKKNLISFYLSKETLNKTNFKYIKKGDLINLEKSLKFGDRLSGHFVQGHVDTTAYVKKITISDRSSIITFKIPKKYKKYLIYKGSITINGVSLTISKLLIDGFQITVIPHTLKLTNLNNIRKNDIINVEFDVLGKYIKNFIKRYD